MKMTPPTLLLRDCALLVPVLAGVGAWLGGPWASLSVGVSGAVAVLNLGALFFVVDRLVKAAESGEGAGAAVALVFGKMLLVGALFGGLLTVLDARWGALGLITVIFGLAVRGALDALARPSPEAAEDV